MAKKPVKKESKPESNPKTAQPERLKRFGDCDDEWKQTFKIEPGESGDTQVSQETQELFYAR